MPTSMGSSRELESAKELKVAREELKGAKEAAISEYKESVVFVKDLSLGNVKAMELVLAIFKIGGSQLPFYELVSICPSRSHEGFFIRGSRLQL